MGLIEMKKENDKSIGRRQVFSFDFKEDSEVCLREEGREFQMTGPIY